MRLVQARSSGTDGFAVMPSQKKYSMTAWETSALNARRALAKADFRGSWRLRQLLARYHLGM
jgi:hypothetical protein